MEDKIFSCQSTSLIQATSPVPFWDIRQYLIDVRSGSFSLSERMRMLLMSLNYEIQEILTGQRRGGVRGECKRTPTLTLKLRPGDLVEVRSKAEILRTLNHDGKNRGLAFAPDMFEYCGGKFRVQSRVEKMVNEETGMMRKISNTVILDGVTCRGKASGGCQRTCYCLWREIWLKKLTDDAV